MCRVYGLSPLARGTLSRIVWLGQIRRFIPAGAGNTLAISLMISAPTVYPRWRGEHYAPKIESEWLNGLSPLARGTRNFYLPHCLLPRFIPAGAGNTLKLYICSKSPFLLSNKLPTVR